MKQPREVRYGLDGFAETHFVGEDAVLVFAPEVGEPVETGQLERFERTAEVIGLLFDFDVRRSSRIGGRSSRKGRTGYACMIRIDGFLCIGDIVIRLPCTVGVLKVWSALPNGILLVHLQKK